MAWRSGDTRKEGAAYAVIRAVAVRTAKKVFRATA